jgi:hypothetical protein
MTGGSDGQSDKIKVDRSRNEILFVRISKGEQIQFLLIFYTITAILMHTRRIHCFMYIPCVQKPIHYIPNTGKRSGLSQTIVNKYTTSLFYLTMPFVTIHQHSNAGVSHSTQQLGFIRYASRQEVRIPEK